MANEVKCYPKQSQPYDIDYQMDRYKENKWPIDEVGNSNFQSIKVFSVIYP